MLIYCNFVFLVNSYLIIAFSVDVFCFTSVLSANCTANENFQYFRGFCIMDFVSQPTFELLISFHFGFFCSLQFPKLVGLFLASYMSLKLVSGYY